MSDDVATHLLSGEHVVFRTRPHWILFVAPALIVVAGLLVLAGPLAVGMDPWWGLPGIAIMVIGLVTVATRALRFLSSEFVVTNMRVIMKVGLLARRSQDMLLQKIETIGVDQSIPGRLLGYGTLTVRGTAAAREPFHHVSDPLAFRRAVQEQAVQR